MIIDLFVAVYAVLAAFSALFTLFLLASPEVQRRARISADKPVRAVVISLIVFVVFTALGPFVLAFQKAAEAAQEFRIFFLQQEGLRKIDEIQKALTGLDEVSKLVQDETVKKKAQLKEAGVELPATVQ